MTYLKNAKHWCVLLLLLLPAAINCPRAVAQDATAYQDACGACHPAAASIARKVEGATVDEKRIYLTDFLKRHHSPDPAAAEAVIRYLLSFQKK